MPDLQSDFVGRVNRLALKPSDKNALGGIASNTAQANMILVGVMVLVLGPIVWINWPFSKTPSITPAPKGPGTQRTSLQQ